MQTIEITNPGVRELDQISKAVRKALGSNFKGLGLTSRDTLLIYLPDTASIDVRQAATAAIVAAVASIDPEADLPTERANKRHEAVTTRLKEIDTALMKQTISESTNIADLRAVLLEVAQALTDLLVFVGLQGASDEEVTR